MDASLRLRSVQHDKVRAWMLRSVQHDKVRAWMLRFAQHDKLGMANLTLLFLSFKKERDVSASPKQGEVAMSFRARARNPYPANTTEHFPDWRIFSYLRPA